MAVFAAQRARCTCGSLPWQCSAASWCCSCGSAAGGSGCCCSGDAAETQLEGGSPCEQKQLEPLISYMLLAVQAIEDVLVYTDAVGTLILVQGDCRQEDLIERLNEPARPVL